MFRKDNRQWLLPLGGCVVVVLVLLFCCLMVASYNFKSIDSEIQDVQTQIEQQSAMNTASNQKVKSEVSGLDMARVNSDDKKAEAFFEKVLTWSSLDEYEKARESVISEYGLSDATDFLDVFFPENTVAVDDNGNIVDSDLMSGEVLNMQYVSMISHVTGIIDSDYQYFTEVTVSSKAQNGGAATGSCVFLYTITEDGTIKDLSAYVVAD